MTAYTEKILKDIQENLSNSEIEEYFNKKCYLSKNEFGEVLNALILSYNHDALKIALASKKFKDNVDVQNQYGEPIVHAMLYAIRDVCNSDEISEPHKVQFKASLFEILNDTSFNFNWNLTDYFEANNPLHIIALMTEWMTIDEITRFVQICLDQSINPLNKNYNHNSPIELFLASNIDAEQKNSLVKNLAQVSDKYLIEITENSYTE